MNKNLKVLFTAAMLVPAALFGGKKATDYRNFWYPAAPKIDPKKKHIACIGDSITYGAGVAETRATDSYPAYLQQLVPEDYQVLNYGLNGRTAQSQGNRPYTKEKFYEISRTNEAEVYIIMLGTNDTKPYNWNPERYREELRNFLTGYMDLPGFPDLYVMQPPKCFPNEKGIVNFDIMNEQIEDGVYQIVAEVCDDLMLPYIDLYNFTKDHPEWFDDGVHPNALGNRCLANFIASQLNLK